MGLLARYRELVWGLVGVAVCMAVLFIGSAVGRNLTPDTCLTVVDGVPTDACYCERLTGGLVEQPSNTWFTFSFTLVGLYLLWRIGWERSTGTQPRHRNLLSVDPFYRTAYGALAVYLGPGSMFFHATMKSWGGFLDSISMYFFASFLLFYNITRLAGWSHRAFLLGWGGFNVVAILIRIIVPGSATILFGIIFGIAAISEVVAMLRLPREPRFPGWLVAAMVAFATAFVVWILSHTGGPLCDPDAVIQGHAVWHVLCAGVVYFLYEHFRTEVVR